MPAVNVNIQPEIINWALSQTPKEKLGDKLMENINQWLAGTKKPTFNQIEDFSRRSNIPLGYFFLQTPPTEQIRLLEYRTIDSIHLLNPSRNLIDTIHEMESIQEWMADYRNEMGFDPAACVGCAKDAGDKNVIADKIRRDTNIKKEWYAGCRNIQEAFTRLRSLLEESGIIVMMSGIVGGNTHRSLNLDEFRAFAMIDKMAPLIFINGTDSWGGRLFSLCHEMVHIWIGEDDLYNDCGYSGGRIKPIEALCNAAAGEILVPDTVFLEKWSQIQENDIYQKIKKTAKNFWCSEIVAARKALDNKKISQNIYDQIVANTKELLKTKQKKNTGGNYYGTVQNRLDRVFVCALCESVNSGRTSYTEAYRLTNTTGKTFPEAARRLGGVLW